ncbi:MAG: transposase [Myxococcota bacterium]
MKRRKRQLSLELRRTRKTGERRGGFRPNAGRKPTAARPLVPHGRREAVRSGEPRHVTLRLRRDLPSLRRKRVYSVVRGALQTARDRLGMRVVHWSVMSNHLHLIVEAKDRWALSRGMQGLKIRMAKALNRLWDRSGAVFGDRYHARALRTPREVRNALLYVLNNYRKHEKARGRLLSPDFVDPFSTAAGFDGWRSRRAHPIVAMIPARPKTWLLRVGWRRRGLLELHGLPSG